MNSVGDTALRGEHGVRAVRWSQVSSPEGSDVRRGHVSQGVMSPTSVSSLCRDFTPASVRQGAEAMAAPNPQRHFHIKHNGYEEKEERN